MSFTMTAEQLSKTEHVVKRFGNSFGLKTDDETEIAKFTSVYDQNIDW
jgi:hypothetical protein